VGRRLRRGSRSRSQRRSKHYPYRVRYAWPEVARKLRPLGRGGTYALARNGHSTEEFKKLCETTIADRNRNCAMECEILGNAALASFNCLPERVLRQANGLNLHQ
jgi:hypothetical protein